MIIAQDVVYTKCMLVVDGKIIINKSMGCPLIHVMALCVDNNGNTSLSVI